MIVHGALMIEPTESESLEELDLFIGLACVETEHVGIESVGTGVSPVQAERSSAVHAFCARAFCFCLYIAASACSTTSLSVSPSFHCVSPIAAST
jgi:hypothetical protein